MIGNSGFPRRCVLRSVALLQPEPQVAVVIPCFNEAPHIGALVEAVRKIVPTVFVVDDGSTDGAADAASDARAVVIRQAGNQGKGVALRAGLNRAIEDGFKFAIVMDGDGQHDPDDLPTFLEASRLDDADLVVGNRMNDTARMPWLRRFVNRWMSRRISRRTGRDLPDTQCGFRLIRLAAWRELNFKAERFEIESEMLLAFVRAGKRVRFVPVRTVYKSHQSKIHPVLDTIRWFRWWWRPE